MLRTELIPAQRSDTPFALQCIEPHVTGITRGVGFVARVGVATAEQILLQHVTPGTRAWIIWLYRHTGRVRTGVAALQPGSWRGCWEFTLWIHPAHQPRPFVRDFWERALEAAATVAPHRVEFVIPSPTYDGWIESMHRHGTALGIEFEGVQRQAAQDGNGNWVDLHMFARLYPSPGERR